MRNLSERAAEGHESLAVYIRMMPFSQEEATVPCAADGLLPKSCALFAPYRIQNHANIAKSLQPLHSWNPRNIKGFGDFAKCLKCQKPHS